MKFKVNSTPAFNEIRIFKVPTINFDAEDYTELIDWKIPNLTVPPLLKNLSCENLKNYDWKRSEDRQYIELSLPLTSS